jgi:hypothetical protein
MISFSENSQIVLEVTNVVVNGGKVYLIIFSNADNYKKDISYAEF